MSDERIDALKRVPFLAPLRETVLEEVARCAHWQTVAPGKQILLAKDASTELYFLISGKVRIILYSNEGRPVLFATLVAGEIFGELAAVDGLPRSATVEALSETLVVGLSAKDLNRMIHIEPEIGVALLKRMASQVRRLSDRVFEFSTLAVQNRIQAELLRLANLSCATNSEALLSPAPTLTEIASRVSTHREAVSRELSRLSSIGLLQRESDGIRILNVNRLSDLVREARGK